jgi:hypothetical protein
VYIKYKSINSVLTFPLQQRSSDSEHLLNNIRRYKANDANIEIDEDFLAPPVWLDNFDEIKFLMSKVSIAE